MVIVLFEPLRGNPIPRALMTKIDEYIPDDFFVDLLNVFKVAILTSHFSGTYTSLQSN